MTSVAGFIFQILYALAIPLLIFGGFFAFWFMSGRKSKRAWVRNMSVLAMGASLGVPLFMVLFLIGLSSGLRCPNGNCKGPTFQEGHCQRLVEETFKGSVTGIQEGPKLYSNINDIEKWRVVVNMTPMQEKLSIPPELNLARGQYMHKSRYIYYPCTYEVECVVGKNIKENIYTYLSEIKISRDAGSYLELRGYDACREPQDGP